MRPELRSLAQIEQLKCRLQQVWAECEASNPRSVRSEWSVCKSATHMCHGQLDIEQQLINCAHLFTWLMKHLIRLPAGNMETQ